MTFRPTVLLSFFEVNGKTMLHQLWVDDWFNREWRPVPMGKEPGKFAECQAFGEYDAVVPNE